MCCRTVTVIWATRCSIKTVSRMWVWISFPVQALRRVCWTRFISVILCCVWADLLLFSELFFSLLMNKHLFVLQNKLQGRSSWWFFLQLPLFCQTEFYIHTDGFVCFTWTQKKRILKRRSGKRCIFKQFLYFLFLEKTCRFHIKKLAFLQIFPLVSVKVITFFVQNHLFSF